MFSFRPYQDQTFEPQPGLNILVGDNGAGKTAILEAAYLLSAARSFRAGREYELAHWGSSSCLVEGQFQTDKQRSRRLSLGWTREDGEWKKSASFQGDKVPRLADFLGCVPMSLFTPDDINLVSGSPSLRRRYLDLQLSKMYPLHLQDLARLKKVVSARNALLRQERPWAELVPWNKLLFELSTTVATRREELLSSLTPECARFHQELSGEALNLELRYRRCWPQEWEQFETRLREVEERERARGVSLLSPQKDDLEIQTDGRSLRVYGSQGQQRMLALCLRLAEGKQLSQHQQEGAILLLDDAFSELDPGKRERLLGLLPEFSQVLVSSAVPLQANGAQVHQIQSGVVLR